MKQNNEKGFALPMVMIAILVGALLVPAFLGHVGTGLIGSRNYHDIMDTRYAADAGVEYATWKLLYGDVFSSMKLPGTSQTYVLPETINGETVVAKLSNTYEIIASDNFESGGVSGGTGWLENWTLANSASIYNNQSYAHQGNYSLRIPGGTPSASAHRLVDLSHQVNAHLRFWYRSSGNYGSGDGIYLRISRDNGSTWTTISNFTSNNVSAAYKFIDVDLTIYGLTDTFGICFESHLSSNRYFYVDDLMVVWLASVSERVAWDQFEGGSANWTGGEGWLNSSTPPYDELPWVPSGTVSIVTGQGLDSSSCLQFAYNRSGGRVDRGVDLAYESMGWVQIYINFNYIHTNDTLRLLLSNNGGSTYPYTLYTWTRNSQPANQWTYYELQIPGAYLTGGFRLRLQSAFQNNQYEDIFWVDNVTVIGIRSFCITSTTPDTTLKSALDYYGGDVDILNWYYVE